MKKILKYLWLWPVWFVLIFVLHDIYVAGLMWFVILSVLGVWSIKKFIDSDF